MTILKKFFIITIFTFFIFNCINLNSSMAEDMPEYQGQGGSSRPQETSSGSGTVSDLVGGLNGTLPNEEVSSGLRDTISKLLGFLQVASGLIAVVVIALTGFNYIVVATPEMKKELKDKMLPMVMGLVLVFGAASIAQFILGAVGG